MMWQFGDGWGWWMVMGWVWMIVFWGLIIWAVVAVVGRLGGEQSRPPADSALMLLERRYAAGEIDHDEFEARRAQLLSHPTPPSISR